MNGHPDSPAVREHAPFTDHVDRSFDGSGPDSVDMRGKKKPLPSAAETLAFIEVHGTNRKKMKVLLRTNHWPPEHEVRKDLWWKICTTVKKMNGNIYHDIVSDLFGPENSYEPSLPAFVDPGNMHHYHLSTTGVRTAKKIVCALGTTRPDISFAPPLYALTSLLLHYVAAEDECFACVEELLLDARRAYLAQTKAAYEAARYVLRELARKYAKNCYQYIVKSEGTSIERVLDNWLWWILVDLPFAYLVRVIDCYLYEGPKILHRVALAILILFHKIQVKGGERGDMDLGAAISQFCEDMPGVSVDMLLKTAFGIRGLSRKEMGRLSVKNEMYVKSLSQNVHRAAAAATLPNSPSCETLNVRVTVPRKFSLQEVSGGMLGDDQWDQIWQWVPPRVTVMTPELLFSTSADGVSLQTFFNKVEGYEQTLIVVKAVTGEVFGAYCSVDWAQRHEHDRNLTYIGTGETFLFSILPDFIRHRWVGYQLGEDTPNSANLFMSGDYSQINIGGGNGTAIHLDASLDMCRTERCDTFDNPAFVVDRDFRTATIEVFAFTD